MSTDKFRAALARMMQERGLNQSELAKKSGISRQLISSYLHGGKQARTPGLDNLTALAHALHVSLEELTGMEIAKGIEKRLADNPNLTEKAEQFAKAYNGLPADDWRRKAISDMLREEFEKRERESQKMEDSEKKDNK